MQHKVPEIVRVAVVVLGTGAAGIAGAVEVDFAMKAGIDFGGATLRSGQFTDGSSHSIKANDGLYLGAGASILNQDRTLEAELTINWKYDSIEASNGSITWTRWPLDALFFYRTQNMRFGGGLTYHMNPTLRSSGEAPGNNADLDSVLGGILQAEYRFSDKGSVGARYTILKYDMDGESKSSNGLGIVVSGSF
jgi:hypothetical protein